MKIIIWGYKLYDHSHSFINWGFYRTFKYMGYDTYWFSDDDDVSTFDFSNCIFMAEGNSSRRMPLRRDGIYFLHNCPKFEIIQKYINFQYYTKDCVKMEHISHGIAVQDDCVFFPWSSPFLPEEFNMDDITKPRGNDVYYIGTVNNPQDNANFQPINEFAKACTENGHTMYVGGGYTGKCSTPYLTYLPGWISLEDEEKYSREAYYLPALQGANQLGNQMLPCRLFKAISFGCDVITTNPLAYDFFDKNVIYGDDAYQLYFQAENRKNELERRQWLFNFVKTNHTYINNIKALMKMI